MAVIKVDLKKELDDIVCRRISPAPLAKLHGVAAVGHALEEYSEDLLEQYVIDFCDITFTKQRIIISLNKFCLEFWGKSIAYVKYEDCNLTKLGELLYKCVDICHNNQINVLIRGNRAEMSIDKDVWRLVFMKGPSVNKRDFNFLKIQSPTLRKEVKMFYRKRLSETIDFRNDQGIALVTTGLNIITLHNPCIKYFRDLDYPDITNLIIYIQSNEVKSQFGRKYSVNSIRKMVQAIGRIINFLMTLETYALAPKYNITEDYEFRNVGAMEKNAECIPEKIIDEIDRHVPDLCKAHQLIYKVLKETGLHAKEVIFMNTDDIMPADTPEYYRLYYVQYKNLWRCVRNGTDAKKLTLISEDLAQEIMDYIANTEISRNASGTNYVFISPRNTNKNNKHFTLPQVSSFVAAINRLIERHNIVTSDGTVWRYTSRQARKSIAVQMAESGATASEIAIRLAHSNQRTTEKYYAEIRQKKLAEMNSEFFQHRFAFFIGEENLSKYSEDERKELYVEFAMDLREVEFGQCSRHFAEGPCGKRSGYYNCATCPKLCTGKPYLTKWEKLRDTQIHLLDDLRALYEKEGIPETTYSSFAEYQREAKILNHAKMVINSIEGENHNG